MFSGIVEAVVPVLSVERRGTGARLRLPAPEGTEVAWEVAPGDSVAVSGCCLTVAEVEPAGAMAFDVSAETLARTWFDALEPGSALNLERSVRLADRLGGHLVSGHVDGGATLVSSEDSGDGGRRTEVEVDEGLERWLVDKASIALDGVGLTVVEPRGRLFSVALVPLTLARTSLGSARPGARLNVEADAIGKWVAHLLASSRG